MIPATLDELMMLPHPCLRHHWDHQFQTKEDAQGINFKHMAKAFGR
jgi:hypothetical protein